MLYPWRPPPQPHPQTQDHYTLQRLIHNQKSREHHLSLIPYHHTKASSDNSGLQLGELQKTESLWGQAQGEKSKDETKTRLPEEFQVSGTHSTNKFQTLLYTAGGSVNWWNPFGR